MLLREYINEVLREAKKEKSGPIRLTVRKKSEKEMLREYLRYKQEIEKAKEQLVEIRKAFQAQFEEKINVTASFDVKPVHTPDIEKKVVAWFEDQMGELEKGIGAILEATVMLDGVLITLTRERKKGSLAYKKILAEVVGSLKGKALEVAAEIQEKHNEMAGTVGIVKTTLKTEGVMDTLKGWLSKFGVWFKRTTNKAHEAAADLTAIVNRYDVSTDQ